MKKILAIAAAAAALVAGPAQATNGMRMIGFGPIQDSMGGASVAAPLDGTTAVTNPAGLSALAPRIDLAGQAFMPSPKYTVNTPGPTFSGSSGRPTDVLPTLAGVYRVQDALTLGFAALGTAGMGVDYGAAPGTGGNKTLTNYVNGRVAPAAAYQVADGLSVGVALNLMYAQMGFEMGGAPKFKNAGSFGYGATVGASYTPAPIVTFGAAFETRSYFQDFEWNDIMGQKAAVSFDQPAVATVGAGLRPTDGLLVALDLQWINWSDVMGKGQPKFTKDPLGMGSFDMRWSDQWVVKAGVQYAIPSLTALNVRAGYNYGAMPLDKTNVQANMVFPAVSEHHVTVGAGYDVGKWGLNAAFVYSPEAKVSAPGPGGTTVTSKMSQTQIELGGAYRF